MEHPLRRCPNCLSVRFFAEPDGDMVFLSVRGDGTFQVSKPPHDPLTGLGAAEISCTGCGWFGYADDLLPPENDTTVPKRVLVHICCGPCSITTVMGLQEEGFEVTGLFFNPNIHPLSEYLKRRDGALQVAEKLGIRLIVKDEEYDPNTYLRATTFREENRCFHCYQLRLERAAQIARKGKFDHFTSTLLYSKMQKHEEIAALGKDMSTEKTSFLYRDFREGWKRGIELSQKWGIYRQQYCGCIYSEYERYQKELQK